MYVVSRNELGYLPFSIEASPLRTDPCAGRAPSGGGARCGDCVWTAGKSALPVGGRDPGADLPAGTVFRPNVVLVVRVVGDGRVR